MCDKEYVATNLYPGCNGSECYGCSYFDHDGHCSAAEDIHDCEYCKTAFTDKRLTEENDLSYLCIGKSANGFSAFIGSSAMHRPLVEISVQQWNEQHQRNHDIFRFTPEYCPMCGRRITENEPYLHLNNQKIKNNV